LVAFKEKPKGGKRGRGGEIRKKKRMTMCMELIKSERGEHFPKEGKNLGEEKTKPMK